MKFLNVPTAKYFVVTHKGKLNTIDQTWKAVMNEIKKLELTEDTEKISFELYNARFQPDSNTSEVDI